MGSFIGGAMGRDASQGDRDKQAAAMQEGVDVFRNINIPELSEQELQLLLPQLMGELTPEMENYISAGPSAFEQIEADPRLKNAQMSALNYLGEVGQTGLTAGERAGMNELRRNTAQESQAKQAQILQDMAQRGVGGSGVELAARLGGNQASADRMSRESDVLTQQAQQRAMEAMMNQANLGGQIRGQDRSEAESTAGAKDVMNKFNVQNQQSLQQRNVGAKNQAQLMNLQEKQRIAEAQTGLKNKQQQYNKDLLQQQFGNQMGRAQGLSGQLGKQGQFYGQRAAETQDFHSGLGGSLDQGFASVVGMSDKNEKTDIKATTDELKKLLNKLESYTYEYKDKENGEGVRAGVMAQDLEKAGDLGKSMVLDTPEGKKVNYSQGFSTIMASLVELNKRLNKLEGGEE